MRRVLREAVVIALETALVLALAATLGPPGGKRDQAAAAGPAVTKASRNVP
jgi:hypothetical protein